MVSGRSTALTTVWVYRFQVQGNKGPGSGISGRSLRGVRTFNGSSSCILHSGFRLRPRRLKSTDVVGGLRDGYSDSTEVYTQFCCSKDQGDRS